MTLFRRHLSSVHRRQSMAGWLQSVCIILALCAVSIAAHAQVPQLFQPLGVEAMANADSATSRNVEKINARPTTSSVTLVRINAAALDSQTVNLNLAADRSVNVNHSRSEVIGRNIVVWHGTMADVPGEATLVIQNGEITGSVNNNGDLYRIESVGNGVHAIVKVDASRFPDDHPPSFKEKEKAVPTPKPAPRKSSSGSGTSDAFPGDGRPVIIDVLVAYTPGASGAVSNISSTIALAVAEANQSYVNSGINIKLNLVDTMSVNYTETGKTFDTILADLVSNNDVRTRRDNRAADLVAMIIKQPDYCGLADAIRATVDTAYAVVHYDCATGYYSFAHELGHLMGARHDPATDSTSTPYAYGHGFQYVSGTTKWRTIMAYACSGGCPRLQYWSNPSVNYGGVAMGTASVSNNARVLNDTAATVAGFRSQGVNCAVFNDGYASQSGSSDAIYFRANGSVCKPDGTASGTCRKWFGRCTTNGGEKANFTVFNDGYANAAAPSDAVYFQQPQKACVPDGTPSGNCRRWTGRALTASGKPVSCYLFNDGYTSLVGPTDAIYARAPGQVCKPDGTATGTCRKWFGRCVAR